MTKKNRSKLFDWTQKPSLSVNVYVILRRMLHTISLSEQYVFIYWSSTQILKTVEWMLIKWNKNDLEDFWIFFKSLFQIQIRTKNSNTFVIQNLFIQFLFRVNLHRNMVHCKLVTLPNNGSCRCSCKVLSRCVSLKDCFLMNLIRRYAFVWSS